MYFDGIFFYHLSPQNSLQRGVAELTLFINKPLNSVKPPWTIEKARLTPRRINCKKQKQIQISVQAWGSFRKFFGSWEVWHDYCQWKVVFMCAKWHMSSNLYIYKKHRFSCRLGWGGCIPPSTSQSPLWSHPCSWALCMT